MRTVQDENGALWIIGEGDPAEPLLLNEQQVLPSRSIRTGICPRAVEWEALLHRFEKAYRATGDGALGLAFLRIVHLWDTAVKLERLTK